MDWVNFSWLACEFRHTQTVLTCEHLTLHYGRHTAACFGVTQHTKKRVLNHLIVMYAWKSELIFPPKARCVWAATQLPATVFCNQWERSSSSFVVKLPYGENFTATGSLRGVRMSFFLLNGHIEENVFRPVAWHGDFVLRKPSDLCVAWVGLRVSRLARCAEGWECTKHFRLQAGRIGQYSGG